MTESERVKDYVDALLDKYWEPETATYRADLMADDIAARMDLDETPDWLLVQVENEIYTILHPKATAADLAAYQEMAQLVYEGLPAPDFSGVDFTGREWWVKFLGKPRIIRRKFVVEAFRAGHITEWQLWQVTSIPFSGLDAVTAKKVLEELGFKPFEGYPLTRKEDRG